MSKQVRVVVLGAGAVGKTALTIKYIQGSWVERYEPTIEDTYCKLCEVDAIPSQLEILDTAGQEAYSTMRDQYMQRGDAFLLTFSITDYESFNEVKKIGAQLRRIKQDLNRPLVVVLAGNKVDIDAQRGVNSGEASKYAQMLGAKFFETSAKTHHNVDEVFTELVRMHRDIRLVPTGTADVNTLMGMTSANTGAQQPSGTESATTSSAVGAAPSTTASAAASGGADKTDPKATATAEPVKPAKQKRAKRRLCTML